MTNSESMVYNYCIGELYHSDNQNNSIGDIKMLNMNICRNKNGKPLKVYKSEFEADEAVSYVKKRYSKEHVSYKCQKCGDWHLSPKEHQTPNHASKCLDSSGKEKQAYPTKESAETRAKIILEERGIELFVYHCNYCGEYHLTHKNDRRRK